MTTEYKRCLCEGFLIKTRLEAIDKRSLDELNIDKCLLFTDLVKLSSFMCLKTCLLFHTKSTPAHSCDVITLLLCMFHKKEARYVGCRKL